MDHFHQTMCSTWDDIIVFTYRIDILMQRSTRLDVKSCTKIVDNCAENLSTLI